MRPGRSERSGFSPGEALVAIVIISVGVLAMAAPTGFISDQVRIAGRATERALAVQTVIEELRSLDYVDVQDRARADAVEVHGYRIWWTVAVVADHLKRVTLVSEGPGFLPGEVWSSADRDTFAISVLEP